MSRDEFLERVYDEFKANGRWPLVRDLQIKLRHAGNVRRIAAQIGLDKVLCESGPDGACLLLLKGIAICHNSERDIEIFLATIRFLASKYIASGPGQINSKDIQQSLRLTDEETRRLGEILYRNTGIWSSARWSQDRAEFHLEPSEDAVFFDKVQTLLEFLNTKDRIAAEAAEAARLTLGHSIRPRQTARRFATDDPDSIDSSLPAHEPDHQKRSHLNPWSVIRGFLLRLSSHDVPDIVDRAGLTVDWGLSQKQNYSHKTRLAAYRPRIDRAYQSLSTDDRLRVAYIVAKELASRALTEELNQSLRKIGWELREGSLVPVGTTVRELFFPEQSQHDAYVEIRGILQKATTSVHIVDPYVDQSILTLLSTCVKTGMTIRLLASKLPPDFVLEAKKWLTQHGGGTLKVRTTKEFHDRFIALDDALCWHVGCSIKDAGNKAFMLSQVEDDENRTALLGQINKSWSAGAIVL